MLWDFVDKRTANVYGIYGHLGGGKSLTAVELALMSLREGWAVASNIQMFRLGRYKDQFKFIEDFQEVDFWSLPCGAPRGSPDKFRSVIIVDECAEFFDQFSSTSPVLKSFLSWLRHSSKRGQFVFLIVQQPEFIAKSLRLLINKWICCVDMDQFRIPLLKLKLPMTSGFVWRRVFDRYGNLISKGWNFADKKYFGRFYSTSQSIALQGRDNDFIEDEKNAKEYNPHFLYIFFLSIVYVFFLWWWM